MKKILSVFLCLILLAAALPLNALASVLLPQKLQAIESEAFMGDTSLYEMELPEGVKTIGERAFKSSSITWLKLPASLTSIADDAFENCHALTLQVWRNSYAHRWCQAHDVRYQVMELPGQGQEFRIHEIFIAENTDDDSVIRTYVSASADCTLKVEMLNDTGDTVLYSCEVSVPAGAAEKKFDFSPSYLPSWFRLRATILRGSSVECTLTNLHYTSAYDAFNQQQPTDFPEETVLDFGESGYAVLAEGVMPLDAAATVSGDEYTFRTALSLKKGDRVKIKVNGEDELIKIASVASHSDGTVTVKADPDAYLADFYDVVMIDTRARNHSAGAVSKDEEYAITDEVSLQLTHGVSVSYTTKMGFEMNFKYDQINWSDDYYEFEAYFKYEISVSLFIGAEIDTWQMDKPFGFTLYSAVPNLPGIKEPVYLEVLVPINLRAAIGGTVSDTISGKFGLRYDPINKATPIADKSKEPPKVEFTGEVTLMTGIEVTIGVSVLDALKAKLSANIGFEANGKPEDSILHPVENASSKHACNGCLDIDFSYVSNIRAWIEVKLTERASVTPVDVNIEALRAPLGKGYFSYLNEPESIHKGKCIFATGLCPNRMYRTPIRTLDKNLKEVEGLPISLTGVTSSGVSITPMMRPSPFIPYLYPGNYTAKAEYENGEVSKDFNVYAAGQTITLQEPEINILVNVKDNETEEPIPGAEITLTLPDESTLTKYSGEDGMYEFESLPIGEYDIQASKNGYITKTITNLIFNDTSNTVTIHLSKKEMTEEEIVQTLLEYMGDDLIARLKADDFDLCTGFYYYSPKNGTGDPVMLFRVNLRSPMNSTWPYTVDDELFTAGQIAIIDSPIFPLTVDERELLKENLLYEDTFMFGNYVELDNNIMLDAMENLNEELIFTLGFNNSPSDHALAWTATWRWDKMIYTNKPQ